MTDLVSHAHGTRVVVIGGGMAGIAAALECARLGLRVTLLEARDVLGGSLDRVALGDLQVDAAADAFPSSAKTIGGLVEEVGLSGELVAPRDDVTWLVGPGGDAAPAPADTLLGIPANPWAPDVRRHIETRGTWRAYLDRLRPPMTVGHQRSLGELVSSRMGDRVRDRLVAPYALAVHGIAPEFIDVDVAASGLNAALTRTGSLGGAVAQTLRPGRGGRSSLPGGLHRLVDALADRLADLDAHVRTGSAVTAIERDGEDWIVRVAGPDADADDAPSDTPPPLRADLVIVAVDEDPARTLLAPHLALPASAGPRPEPLDVVMLRLRGVELPDRGALVIGSGPSPATVRPISRTWEWLAAALPPGEHVLRVTLAARAPADTAGDDDAAVIDAARHAASALLALDLPRAAVVASARITYTRAAPGSLLGHAAAVDEIRAAVRGLPGLAVVGGWLSGNSLERVAADAVAEADAVRRAALWRGVDLA